MLKRYKLDGTEIVILHIQLYLIFFFYHIDYLYHISYYNNVSKY